MPPARGLLRALRVSGGINQGVPCKAALPHLPFLLVSRSRCSCLEFLLDNGADPSLRDKQGYTAVHYAAAYGNRQNLELVSELERPSVLPGEGSVCQSLRGSRVGYGFVVLLLQLLEMSFNCLEDVESTVPVSPLHLAVSRAGPAPGLRRGLGCGSWRWGGFPAAVGAEQGTRQRPGSCFPHGPFSLCVEVRALSRLSVGWGFAWEQREGPRGGNCPRGGGPLRAGSPDSAHRGLLRPQAYNGHCEALKTLAETLVNLDVRDHKGRTALYLATERGSTECVEVLTSHGASALVKERKRKWTPLHAAGDRVGDSEGGCPELFQPPLPRVPVHLGVRGGRQQLPHTRVFSSARARAGPSRGLAAT